MNRRKKVMRATESLMRPTNKSTEMDKLQDDLERYADKVVFGFIEVLDFSVEDGVPTLFVLVDQEEVMKFTEHDMVNDTYKRSDGRRMDIPGLDAKVEDKNESVATESFDNEAVDTKLIDDQIKKLEARVKFMNTTKEDLTRFKDAKVTAVNFDPGYESIEFDHIGESGPEHAVGVIDKFGSIKLRWSDSL